jgi:E3 SUMO-protein ligase PIAS1
MFSHGVDRRALDNLHLLRVKDLALVCQMVNMPRSGNKTNLTDRIRGVCSSPVLVHAAGGKGAVERALWLAYHALAADKGCSVDDLIAAAPSPSSSASRKRRAEEAAGALRAFSSAAAGHDSGGGHGGGGHGGGGGSETNVWQRALAADPFWAAADEPKMASTPGVVLPPTRLRSHAHGKNVHLDRPFTVTPAQAKLLKVHSDLYELQMACVLLDDPVPARLHWPFLAALRVNGHPLPVMYRLAGNPMGKAGRDPPVAIPPNAVVAGTNRLTFTCQDTRPFAVLLRVAKRRTKWEVKGLVPAPPPFASAKAHLERSLGGGPSARGGTGGAADDSDDDLIVEDTAVLSLKCPITGRIMRTPARARGCQGMASFDLDDYLEMNERTRKWTCPNCGASGRPSDLVIDAFLTRVVGVLRARSGGEDTGGVARIEVESSGRWRPCPPEESNKDKDATRDDATWVAPEALERVVVGVGGSVLNVPPDLAAAGEGGAGGGGGGVKKAAEGAAERAVDVGEESEDEAEELRRAVAEATRGAEGAAGARRGSGGGAEDVIVISDSDDDDDDDDTADDPGGAVAAEASRPVAAGPADEAAAAELAAIHAWAARASLRADVDAAAEASTSAAHAAMAAARLAAEAAEAFRASEDSRRIGEADAVYSAMAAAYYDARRESVSAAEASRARTSAAAEAGAAARNENPPLSRENPRNQNQDAAGDAAVSVSARAASAVPSPSEVARGGVRSQSLGASRAEGAREDPGRIGAPAPTDGPGGREERAAEEEEEAPGAGAAGANAAAASAHAAAETPGGRPALKFVFRRTPQTDADRRVEEEEYSA